MQYEDGKRNRRLPIEPQILGRDLPSSGCKSLSSSGEWAQESDSAQSNTGQAVRDGTNDLEPIETFSEAKQHKQRRTDKGKTPKVPLKRLAQDDIEIENYEKKLGIKKGRQSVPQAFINDGLDEFLEGMVEDDTTCQINQAEKKAAYDSWLSTKRRKLNSQPEVPSDSDFRLLVGSCDPGSKPHHGARTPEMKYYSPGSCSKPDLASNWAQRKDDHSLTKTDDQASRCDDNSWVSASLSSLPRPRENPYVAPTKGASLAKYVPPSRRHEEEEEDEAQSRIHIQKRLQGVVNRLSDGNFISLAQTVESIYQSNARGKVTELLTDAILAQIRKPETLTDQFFVLVGGFSAAIYKIKGSSFGSHLVKQLVKEFSEQYAYASDHVNIRLGIRKEPSNLLTFLTQLYVFEVLGCGIIFDYLEKLFNQLSELNVELLLRVCRMAGKLLRRDDPETLKHVSDVLNTAVSKVGYTNISVRTKFMIETIQDLKNSKIKAKGLDSAIVSEHVIRMKKRLAELKSQNRRLEGVIPMGLRLKDIEDVDRHGKWWLVGASVPKYRDITEKTRQVLDRAKGTFKDTINDEDMDFVLPDFQEKAKAQGFNTSAQISIFTAIMSALDYEHAYRQFTDLKLKRDEQLEITKVLVQCVGSELHYNEYYALVGCQACTNSKIRFSFQDRLWGIFRGLGESLFGTEVEEESTDGQRLKNDRRLRNVAQFYASLVTDGCLSITLLKPLQLFKMNSWSSIFVEWFILSLLRGCQSKKSRRGDKVKRIFTPAREIPTLAAGLHWFLRKRMRDAVSIERTEVKGLQEIIDKAQTAVDLVSLTDL
ncbi:hypothetical protein E4U43_006923 [Claviceps pusilla]|uniref:MI domain-containing protein n=1 Tax=Claviceps pusilla TaxID=123648 RepID=A0A9P7NFI0_9HYPO|nr:hypothetical protein E4U43_006923 [Claviceps pusilla]